MDEFDRCNGLRLLHRTSLSCAKPDIARQRESSYRVGKDLSVFGFVFKCGLSRPRGEVLSLARHW